MSDDTPAKADKASEEPIVDAAPPVEEARAPELETGELAAPDLVEPDPAPSADTEAVATAVADPAGDAPTFATGDVAPLDAAPAVAAASAVPAQQLVYVQAAVPPKKRGNRLVGSLLSVVGAVIFAGVYALVGGFIIDLRDRDLFGPEFVTFLGSAFFWVPVIVFLVGLILLVLLLNRAGWWAHVFGSLILAIAVYFGMIGVLLLIANVFHGTPDPITFASLAVNPWVIAAAVVAREVSIWTGLGIAARGRRVKVRNVEARAAFDREQEAKRAEYAGTAAGVPAA